MAASNLNEVLDQIKDAGLIVELPLRFDRFWRCRVEGMGKEKRGWYRLREIHGRDGRLLIVGSYGVFQGAGCTTHQIKLDTKGWSDEERAAMRRDHAASLRRAEAAKREREQLAARHAARVWARLSETGDSQYLARKRVGAFGIRFAPDGTIAVPVSDAGGVIHGLEYIRPKGGKRLAKEFWPGGLGLTGHYHLIGNPTGAPVILVAEGYATAASLHMATGRPVAVAFFANNLGPVVEAVRKRWQRARILICADDDAWQTCIACEAPVDVRAHPEACPSCGKVHRKGNGGIHCASVAALAHSCHWIAPVFADEAERERLFRERGEKTSDFNDLHAWQGLPAVRSQVEDRIAGLGWSEAPQAPAVRGVTTEGGGESGELRLIDDLDGMLSRFVLLYGGDGVLFDALEHVVVTEADVRRLCISRDLWKAFESMRDRKVARISELGFDPTEQDPRVRCNLWGGWPMKPQPGACERLLQLLRYMCSEEAGPVAEALYRWVLCWLALPLQRPGTKMRSTIIIHGPQGVGKNLFLETYAKIFGPYSAVLDQDAVEDKYNDWASRKLFLIADEVVARQELFHVKNKLKGLITGNEIRINPKHKAAYGERNQANFVFLSNEPQPAVLEQDDRRHAVIWTPSKLPKAFYAEVQREIDNGGAAALYDWLLRYPIPDDFGPGTEPPMTDAKRELIALAADTVSQFALAVDAGDVPPLKCQPGLSRDWYRCYVRWCQLEGMKAANAQRFANSILRRHGWPVRRVRYVDSAWQVIGPARVLCIGGEPDLATAPREAEMWGDYVRDTADRAVRYAGDDIAPRPTGSEA